MKHLALLALADADVDWLSRLRRRDDIQLAAVFHPDPDSLLSRLAGLSDVPVFTDLEALAEIPIDICVGSERARPWVTTLAGHAAAAGRPAPRFFDLEELREEEDFAARAPAVSSGVTVEVSSADLVHEEEEEEALEPVAAAPEPVVEPEASPKPSRPAPTPKEEPAPATRLGVPTIDLFYDPQRLAGWLAKAAREVAGAESSVVWRRESDGRRWVLMAFDPDPDRLPAVSFPPEFLDERIRAGMVSERVGPGDESADDAIPQRALYVPLAGETEPFGLIGLFRPWEAGEWPRAVRAEFEGRAGELGRALERCVSVSRLGSELKHLQFKERIRDLLLDGHRAADDRWRRGLSYLVESIPARAAWYFEGRDHGARLELLAAASTRGPITGSITIPAGIGLAGMAFEQGERLNWLAESPGPSGDLVALPVEAGSGDARSAVGVLVFEGVPPASRDEGEASRRLDLLREILAPLLAPNPGA